MSSNISGFTQLSAVNVNGKTEKKGKFTYLSWSFAVKELMKADPLATWEFNENTIYPDGSMMVSCSVTAFNKTLYMWLPVMNNTNKAIQNPNAMDINKTMMRCLVKCIAVHGLGLYIYAGEDLPSDDAIHVVTNAKYTEYCNQNFKALKTVAQEKGTEELKAAFKKLDLSEFKAQFWNEYKETLKGLALQRDDMNEKTEVTNDEHITA